VGSTVHVDALGISGKNRTGLLSITRRQIAATQIFFFSNSKISLKITKSPTTK